MPAYNTITLHNVYVREQAAEAFISKCISAEQQKMINEAHPVDLYTPNLFVRVGLGVLTLFIILFSAGLFFLLLPFHNSESGLMIFFGLLCYTMLEVMAGKKHYNSGVDNILLISIVICIIGGIGFNDFFSDGNAPLFISFMACIVCSFLAVRFIDSLMAAGAVLALLFFAFYAYSRWGYSVQATTPFFMILFSGVLYYLAQKVATLQAMLFHRFALRVITIICLLVFYFSGNVYVVSEVNQAIFHSLGVTRFPVALAWFFWLWTLLLPVLYLVKGIRSKDPSMIRVAMVLIVAGILTFRYYYAILPAEVALTIGGILGVIISYSLIRYLRVPHYGYTFEDFDTDKPGSGNLEALVIGEAFGNKATPQEHTKFGGGSFGGAGAGDNY